MKRDIANKINFLEESEFDKDFIEGFDYDDYKMQVEELVAKLKSSKCKRLIKKLRNLNDRFKEQDKKVHKQDWPKDGDVENRKEGHNYGSEGAPRACQPKFKFR